MTFGKVTDDQYLIRFEKGEEILPSLRTFCKHYNITNATVSGIGSLENPTLAHYHVDNKKYSEKKIEGIFEVVSLLGNIAIFEKNPLPHLHVTLSDEEMHVIAGHLIQGTVSATLEVTLIAFPSTYNKKHDEEIGLNLWDLPETLPAKDLSNSN